MILCAKTFSTTTSFFSNNGCFSIRHESQLLFHQLPLKETIFRSLNQCGCKSLVFSLDSNSPAPCGASLLVRWSSRLLVWILNKEEEEHVENLQMNGFCPYWSKWEEEVTDEDGGRISSFSVWLVLHLTRTNDRDLTFNFLLSSLWHYLLDWSLRWWTLFTCLHKDRSTPFFLLFSFLP